MTRRACLLVALMIASGCTYDVGSSSAAETHIITDSCEVAGLGVLGNGDFLSGYVSGPDATIRGAWTHVTASGDAYVITPERIQCRINGHRYVDVWGTATDGTDTYAVQIFAEDRSEPGPPEIVEGTPEVRTMTASRTYRPSRWHDARIDERLILTVPSELPVTVGNAGNQWAWLSFQRSDTLDVVTCRYRGGASRPNPTDPADVAAGEAYSLERCTGEWHGTAPVTAGSRVDARWVRLHVQTGAHRLPSRSAAETEVTLDLDVTPLIVLPRDYDYYAFELRDGAGVSVFFSDGDVVRGDLRVRQN